MNRRVLSPPLALAAAAAGLLSCAPPEAPVAPAAPAPREERAPGPVYEDLFADTSSPDEVFRRGMALYQDQRFNEAARAFLQATRLRGQFVDAHYFAARSMLRSRPTDHPGAEREFLAALEIQPNDAEVRLALAQAYYQWGRYDSAAEQLALARQLAPRDRELLHLSGAVTSRLGRHEEAVGHLRGALEADPRHLPSLLDLGQALGHLGRDEEALAAYRLVLAQQPLNAQALMGAGTSLQRLGRTEEARKMLMEFKRVQGTVEGREMEGKRVDVRLRQIEEAYRAGDRHAAERAAHMLMEEFPDDTDGLLRLGALQAQAGDLDGAMATYRELLVADPENLSAAQRLSLLYERVGDAEQAAAWRKRSEEMRKATAGRQRP